MCVNMAVPYFRHYLSAYFFLCIYQLHISLFALLSFPITVAMDTACANIKSRPLVVLVVVDLEDRIEIIDHQKAEFQCIPQPFPRYNFPFNHVVTVSHASHLPTESLMRTMRVCFRCRQTLCWESSIQDITHSCIRTTVLFCLPQ